MGFEKSGKTLNRFDALIILLSIIFYILDTVTDVLSAVLYIENSNIYWGCLTIGLVIIPSIIVQIFSARWYVGDGLQNPICCLLTHLLQFQPLERYTLTLVAGLEARRINDELHIERFYIKQNDVSMLRLIAAFLQCAPQFTLQLYVTTCTTSAHLLTVISACVSLLCLGWAVAAYSHALRQAYQRKYSCHGAAILTQTLCHILIVAARGAAIVSFAAVFHYWVFLGLGVHWLIMTIWIIIQNTDFCENAVEEKFFAGIVGVIYCFNFFNLKEGNTRWRALAYYCIMAIENGAALALWYIWKPQPRSWFDPLVCVSVTVCFTLGLSILMLYYGFCHPSQPFACTRKHKRKRSLHMTIDSTSSKTSTPVLNKHVSVKSVTAKPGLTINPSTSRLLKPQNSRLLHIQYKQVNTPSHLSPITDTNSALGFRNKHSYNDCSLEWDDQSGFQHYSVDATAGLRSFSRVSALQTAGSNLSDEDLNSSPRRGDLEMATFGHARSPTQNLFSVPEYMGNTPVHDYTQSPYYRPSSRSASIPRKILYEDPYSSPYKSGNSSKAVDEGYPGEDRLIKECDGIPSGPCLIEECNHCGKNFPFMDASIENIADNTDCTLDFCNCTMMGVIDNLANDLDANRHPIDYQFSTQEQATPLFYKYSQSTSSNKRHDFNVSNDTTLTDSSGFHSRASNYGNGGTASVENSPGLDLAQEVNAALPKNLKFLY